MEYVLLPDQPALHGSIEPSHVLVAIGLKEEYIGGALRVTLGRENSKEDVDFLVECIRKFVNN